MKKYYLGATGILTLFLSSWSFQNPIAFDLHQLVKQKGIEVFNRQLSLIDEASYPGIRLSKEFGEGVAWIKDIDFSNGIVEFDVRGENVMQHSFVGVAFHGQNDSTFEAIYLRPFRFGSDDQELRNHDVQYVSLPKFTWRVLRANSPGVYEGSIEPAPDPNSWVRVRMVIRDSTVSTYINGDKQPSLVVKEVTNFKGGSIGFYVADTSGGDFANLSITKTN